MDYFLLSFSHEFMAIAAWLDRAKWHIHTRWIRYILWPENHDIKRVICGPTYSFPGTSLGPGDFASFSLRRCIEGLLWCPWCSKSWSGISGRNVDRVAGLGGNCNRRKFVCARRVLRLCPESPSWHLRNSKLSGSQRDNDFHDKIAGCSMFYYSLQKYIYYATSDMFLINPVSL